MSSENEIEIVDEGEEETNQEESIESEPEEEEVEDEVEEEEEKGGKKEKGKGKSSSKRKKSDGGDEKSSTPSKKKPKKEKVESLDGKESVHLIQTYMNQQNRPYSVNQVCDNLHGKIKKTLVAKILEELSENGKMTMKEFGKNKIFSAVQEEKNVDPNHFEVLNKKIVGMEEEYKLLTEEQQKLQKGKWN